MKKNKKLFAILTLVAFMMTLMPVMAFAADAFTQPDWTDDADAFAKMLYGQYEKNLAAAIEAEEATDEIVNVMKSLLVDNVNDDSEAAIDKFLADLVKEMETGEKPPVDPDEPTDPTDPVDPVEPTNKVSKTASIINTKDSEVSLEKTSNYDENKAAEVQIVLRDANDRTTTAANTPVYVWAESTKAIGHASDALLIKDYEGKDVDGVYKLSVTSITDIEVFFRQAGTFKLKASLDNPADSSVRDIKTFNNNASKDSEPRTIITVTSPSVSTRDWAFGASTEKKVDGKTVKETLEVIKPEKHAGNTEIEDGDIAGYVKVDANTVATTKVELNLLSAIAEQTGKRSPVNTYPISLSTNSSNIELSKTTITTDYAGNASFHVAGLREGEYKIYVTFGDFEATLLVQVGATAANNIQLIKFPSNPIATDTEVDDYKNIFRFQLTDANGNIVTDDSTNPGTPGAENITKKDPNSDEVKFIAIVSAPEANKVLSKDIRLKLVKDKAGKKKDYYTLDVVGGKKFEAEGDYELRIVLDNGKSVTLNFSVKKFDKAVSLNIEYPTQSVELNSTTDVPDIYFLDANNVMKKANNRVTVAASGYAAQYVEPDGRDAGYIIVKNDEKYIGQTITVTAVSDKENLVGTTTLTVADEAKEVKLDTTRGQVNASNRVGFKVVDTTGNPVALGTDATVEVTAVVANTGDADAKVSYSIPSSSRSDLQLYGTGVINLSSNRETTATVQIMVKVTKPNHDKDDNTGLSTTYYTGTETFTFGAEADKSVVMTIGSKEIVANNVPATIDVAPFIKDNRTFVPFRALVEAFGAEVSYDEATSTVTTKLDGKTVVLTVGSTVLTVNDETVTMDVAPYIVDDRVVVPVRFVGEAFGFTVEATQDAASGATASVVFYQK